MQNFTFSNSYSKASISGFSVRFASILLFLFLLSSYQFKKMQSKSGGLFGLICFLTSNCFLTISDSYSSTSLAGLKGAVIGSAVFQKDNSSLSFSNVFFNNDSLTLQTQVPAIGNGSSTDGSSPQGLPCLLLYNQVLNTFNQSSVWGGDALRSEFSYNYGYSNCTLLLPASSTTSSTSGLSTSTTGTSISTTSSSSANSLSLLLALTFFLFF